MAQFTAQGRLKLFFNGDGASFGVETRDPFHNKFRTLRSIQAHRRRLRFLKSTTRVDSSFSEKKSRLFNVEASINVSDAGIHDESEEYDGDFETDDLACFRGLVLDISYRQVVSGTYFMP
ncbi:hypothetical protein Pint_20184 [Pistacia integerrima]|uniref:Uncharacterized protein n=1 Tax=Pistacia integerrima TaxID=434235 RepID=A0ACC0X939_9ROSI|nr:hypothetical protein Pint_20184 [Pistacia integerrima]